MNESEFILQLIKWQLTPRDAILPTASTTRLFRRDNKIKIIKPEQEHLIYDNIKPLEITDELYKTLQEKMKLNDSQILLYIHKQYEKMLKDIKRQIKQLQKNWTDSYVHTKAGIVILKLKYLDIYQINDLVNNSIVPIEIILKLVFDIDSKYGDHRRIKRNEEIFVDPRVLETYNELVSKDIPLSTRVRE